MISEWISKERRVWHRRFVPSLIAGIAVAIISFFFQFTVPNIVLLASLGSSAAILTHKQVHKLTILRTVITSYLLALLVSLVLLGLVHGLALSFPVASFLAVAATTLIMYLFDVFHPPAVSASLSFMMLDAGLWQDLLVFLSVIVLLVVVKLLTYTFYYGNVKWDRFKREFHKIERDFLKELTKR